MRPLRPLLALSFLGSLALVGGWLRSTPDITAEPADDAIEPLVAPPPPEPSPGAMARPAVDPPEEPAPEPAPDPPLDERWSRPAGAASLARAKIVARVIATEGRPHARESQGKDFDIVFDPSSRRALRHLKETLVDLAEARLREAVELAGGEPLPARGLSAFMMAPLSQVGLVGGEDDLCSVTAQGWLDGRLMGVVVSLPITGGSDDVLALFERSGSSLRRSLVVARHDYTSITSGQLALDYQVRAVGDGYHVMTVHSSPWISSAWRGARLQIFAPGEHPSAPRRLFDEGNSARIGEVGAELSITSDGFRASFVSWDSLGDGMARTHLRHLALQGGAYRRVAPHVELPQHLPDEWLRLPWSQAAQITSPASRERLEKIHERLQQASARESFHGALEVETVGTQTIVRVRARDRAPLTFVVEPQAGELHLADAREE